MKTKKKLSLNKQTISHLNRTDMETLWGGTSSYDTFQTACGPTDIDCPNTRFCPTNGCVTTAYVKTYCVIINDPGTMDCG